MAIIEEIIDADTADGPMAVVRKCPAGGSDKRVLVFMDAPGIRPSLHDFAARLAAEGYDVAMLDLWHRHGRLIGYEPADAANNPNARPHIREMLAALDDAEVQMDRDAALALLGWDRGVAAAIGFCMGARFVHKAMQELPEQFVVGAMWHPSFLADDTDASPHLTVGEIGELWIGIGTADKVQSIEMHQRYFDAAEAHDNIAVRIFEGADHGYTWPVSPNYHEEAAAVGWTETLSRFRTYLA